MTIKLAERRNLLRQWRRLDTTGAMSGCLKFEKLGELLTAMGGEYDAEEVEEVRMRIRDDQARFITYQEFLRWWAGDGAVEALVNEGDVMTAIAKLKKLKAAHADLDAAHADERQRAAALQEQLNAATAAAVAVGPSVSGGAASAAAATADVRGRDGDGGAATPAVLRRERAGLLGSGSGVEKLNEALTRAGRAAHLLPWAIREEKRDSISTAISLLDAGTPVDSTVVSNLLARDGKLLCALVSSTSLIDRLLAEAPAPTPPRSDSRAQISQPRFSNFNPKGGSE